MSALLRTQEYATFFVIIMSFRLCEFLHIDFMVHDWDIVRDPLVLLWISAGEKFSIFCI